MSGKSLEERFNELCKIVQSLPKNGIFEPTDENKLKFYSFYKQATIGPVNTPQPYFFNIVERAKWDAWNSVKDLNKEQAMQGYIDEMKEALKPALHEHLDHPLTQSILVLLN